jgi:Protein of unknown function
MQPDVAKDLLAACEKTIASLTEAEHAIGRIANEEERRSLLQALSGIIGQLLSSVRAPAVRQYPELEPAAVLGPPDTDLSTEDQIAVAKLSSEDIQVIDHALLSECAPSWRKVARVVGAVLNALQETFLEVPDGYYAQRVRALVESGRLESQGNLQHMRSSEVRLASSHRSAV